MTSRKGYAPSTSSAGRVWSRSCSLLSRNRLPIVKRNARRTRKEINFALHSPVAYAKQEIMTPEMAFECMLVTPDPAVFSAMEGLLQDFSIATKVCPYPSKAANLLKEGSTDLIVIDLEAEDSSGFLRQVGSRTRQKPTVLGVCALDSAVPGVHVILQKPVTRESGFTSLKAAYSRMVRDFRKHTRFAVMKQLTATDDDQRALQITITNIGEGGVGVTSVETLRIGGILSFRVRLPELTNEISVQARILWTRPYGAAGGEFVHIPPFDLQLLHAWLESRYRIKKPLIPI